MRTTILTLLPAGLSGCLAWACSAPATGGAPLTAGTAAGSGPAGTSVTTPLVVHIAGDSTAASFPAGDARVGWGAVFQEQLSDGASVDDRALSGRSTKSFIDEGAWGALIGSVQAGDYVFIGFAHNDEKSEDPTRFTDPATTFADNLRRFVSETRGAGAEPLLLTPISRRKFAGASITPSHGAYPDAVKAVAADSATPCLDLTEKTRVWLESLGPEASVPFFAPDDQTHTSRAGAQEISKLVAVGLRELGHPLAARLRP